MEPGQGPAAPPAPSTEMNGQSFSPFNGDGQQQQVFDPSAFAPANSMATQPGMEYNPYIMGNPMANAMSNQNPSMGYMGYGASAGAMANPYMAMGQPMYEYSAAAYGNLQGNYGGMAGMSLFHQIPPAPATSVPEFLFQLTKMLTDDNKEIIEWVSGKIAVHNPNKLATTVLHRYFRHSKYASFQRQLNYFGFRKIAGKGKMSPCSYVNADVTADLSSLLKIKRKTNSSGRRGIRGRDDAADSYASGGPPRSIRPGRLGSTRSSKYAKQAQEEKAAAEANGDGANGTQTAADTIYNNTNGDKKRNILTYNPPPAAFAVNYSKRQKVDDPTAGPSGGSVTSSVPGLVSSAASSSNSIDTFQAAKSVARSAGGGVKHGFNNYLKNAAPPAPASLNGNVETNNIIAPVEDVVANGGSVLAYNPPVPDGANTSGTTTPSTGTGKELGDAPAPETTGNGEVDSKAITTAPKTDEDTVSAPVPAQVPAPAPAPGVANASFEELSKNFAAAQYHTNPNPYMGGQPMGFMNDPNMGGQNPYAMNQMSQFADFGQPAQQSQQYQQLLQMHYQQQMQANFLQQQERYMQQQMQQQQAPPAAQPRVTAPSAITEVKAPGAAT